MRDLRAINEATINDVLAAKHEILSETDEKFDICKENFNKILKHLKYLNDAVNLLEQGMIEQKKQIIEQQETIVYMEDWLRGQELSNVKNENRLKSLKNMFKKFINK